MPCSCSLTLVSLLIPPPATAHGCPVTDAATERRRGETRIPPAQESQSWAESQPQGTDCPCVYSPKYHCAPMHKASPWETIVASPVAAGWTAPAWKWAPKLAGLKKEAPNLVNLGHVGARL